MRRSPLVEICTSRSLLPGPPYGTIAFFGEGIAVGSDREWLSFLASAGAVLLTFLAGAELDPAVMRTKISEVSLVGLRSGSSRPSRPGPPSRRCSSAGR